MAASGATPNSILVSVHSELLLEWHSLAHFQRVFSWCQAHGRTSESQRRSFSIAPRNHGSAFKTLHDELGPRSPTGPLANAQVNEVDGWNFESLYPLQIDPHRVVGSLVLDKFRACS